VPVLTRDHLDAPPQPLHRHAQAEQAQLTLADIAHDREDFSYREAFSFAYSTNFLHQEKSLHDHVGTLVRAI
jgi:hypothetical protein